MNKIIPALALFFAPVIAFSQARLVINGATAVTIVENGGTAATPIYLEIANPAANAITTIGALGWIVSEREFDMVKWDIGTTVANYTVPFGLGTTYNLPLTMDISVAGVGAGSILFSTYHTIADQKLGVVSTTGKPSDVTNMGAMNNPGLPSANDNSYNTVDRFWEIDAKKFPYATKPTLSSIMFTYAHSGASAEFAAPNNVADEADLIAQRFNSGFPNPNTWGDWLGSGPWAIAGNVGTVTNTAAVSPANFFRSWTLSNSINPLPVVLSSFTAQCDNGAALIQWTTQSEINSDYFTVEKSSDGVHFVQVGNTIPGAGSTSLASNYSTIDPSPFEGQSYYKLLQTDIDGNVNEVGNPISFTDCGTDVVPLSTVTAFNTASNIEVQINSTETTNYNISLVNMLGQTIFSGVHEVALGENEVLLPNNLSPGVYILSVKNDKVNYAKKMVLGVK